MWYCNIVYKNIWFSNSINLWTRELYFNFFYLHTTVSYVIYVRHSVICKNAKYILLLFNLNFNFAIICVLYDVETGCVTIQVQRAIRMFYSASFRNQIIMMIMLFNILRAYQRTIVSFSPTLSFTRINTANIRLAQNRLCNIIFNIRMVLPIIKL